MFMYSVHELPYTEIVKSGTIRFAAGLDCEPGWLIDLYIYRGGGGTTTINRNNRVVNWTVGNLEGQEIISDCELGWLIDL